jgi:hypothetical protein
MLYMFECHTKKKIPRMAKAGQIQEWVKVCKDELLHKKCRMIRCYEPITDSPGKLLLILETDDAASLDLIHRDFGNEWNIEVYPVAHLHEILEEDHSVVAG